MSEIVVSQSGNTGWIFADAEVREDLFFRVYAGREVLVRITIPPGFESPQLALAVAGLRRWYRNKYGLEIPLVEWERSSLRPGNMQCGCQCYNHPLYGFMAQVGCREHDE